MERHSGENVIRTTRREEKRGMAAAGDDRIGLKWRSLPASLCPMAVAAPVCHPLPLHAPCHRFNGAQCQVRRTRGPNRGCRSGSSPFSV